MPVTALGLYLIFAVLGFGWRSWTQYRHTGSTGFRGIHGRPGSPQWLAGAGFLAAILAGAAAPLLQLLGIVNPVTILQATWIQTTGIVLAGVGIAATLYAQRDMGQSWRIGVDPNETTTLVRHGVFALVRNPIFAAMLIFAAGITLITPNPLALVAFLVLLVTIELQVRVVEEPYLNAVHGRAYRDYCGAVGRFVPHIGRSLTV
ncbi:protein-S-isoprenylcysteine methyltransferase [Mycolicibacterium phlei]|jgi:protein-S-isoprenylcysteine O-methyltransferase Ste14|uniref:Protein-S-isoprenylcysteine methyltransferase n=1 Tax=Mycolicibacterium phlei DSM 43239 = CCUG 21000 TaxID=1226750 RepID=A0A5N5V6A0_MYCPH|nr:isoprenylcysteine carboxylmethyltransferase family protein [Mycolicibacterium phlei]VEG10446.1 protein-S-isoprenylcysteine methyltransferase [Mycobacteroides chelonae]AMO62344.1 Isoprenylcysteine carboxyl methyltransferase (ICMT) family protein [Mycolicibacterium phlei]KAB7757336.1 protein-S-isoprenylcysteine methyltransferase [Mycolicibacterium phlei DSM 43239 = CCUG 21000]KXW66232.1 protein-S-isoprenylcysteine methyltransferase [Mycolicibacterium phlei DSM 43239 = CCUG 21000]KXW67696.1 pr